VTASDPAIEKQKAAAAKTKESFRFIVIIPAVGIIFIINEAIHLTKDENAQRHEPSSSEADYSL
jgi:hypothetical protein